MNKYWEHFKTITKHKWIVMKMCFKVGLYWQGIAHDISKYSPTEFASSARYFQGTSSPIDEEKRINGYSLAWQHHKGHNPHHWEYWIDNLSSKQNNPIRVPYKYALEMICDWVGAGMAYNKGNWTKEEPYRFYDKTRSKRLLDPSTAILLEDWLKMIEFGGLNYFAKNCHDTELAIRYVKGEDLEVIK